MAEKVLQRRPEPEPKELIYDYIYNWRKERKQNTINGKVIIKGKDTPWEQSRQGLIKFFLHPQVWPEVAAPNWFFFIHRIAKHSGKHRHQGGLGLFVVAGKGYTVVDGVKYDWEEGDLILLPLKPEGCEHQHFNADPNGPPAEWLAVVFDPFRDACGNELEQRETSPDWKDKVLEPPPHMS